MAGGDATTLNGEAPAGARAWRAARLLDRVVLALLALFRPVNSDPDETFEVVAERGSLVLARRGR
jgi:hypothetical protein